MDRTSSKKMRTIAVIMAGGSGQRFWPRSRRDLPKQLLPLTTGRPMLLEALDRCEGIAAPKDRWVVAGPALEKRIKSTIKGKGSFLREPAARNTAPCIGLAAAKALSEVGDAVLAVFPADHHISNPAVFRREIKKAVKRAAARDEIITLGITPTHPATGYGYIRMGGELGGGFHDAAAFVEKPSLAKAKSYLRSQKYLWNAGIFVARASVLIEAIRTHLPDLAEVLELWQKNKQRGEEAYLKKTPSISIDYGVMEQAENVTVLPSRVRWSDVGSWPALSPFMGVDEFGNVSRGELTAIDTRDCLIDTDTGIVATVGLQDLIVVRHGDAVLICPKERDQEIRELVKRLPEAYQ